MKNYYNNTRFAAIVTVNVESSNDLKAGLLVSQPGEDKVVSARDSTPGYHDVWVDAGKELRVADGTVASFIAVRSGP